MLKHVLSVLVENQAGVLNRITGLFSRRSYNIESLSVGVTEAEDVSRITIVTTAGNESILQIKEQVEKLIDVLSVQILTSTDAVFREIALIKVSATTEDRAAIISLANIFRATIIDVASGSLVIEITGNEGKIMAFVKLMEQYGILEVVRTGLTGIERGHKIIKNYKKFEEDYND